uniref:MIP18 family-like domain-containing protein n=1 Tax=Anopheles atroparvus TaxID=41427 RepID=A0A182J0Z7_ANOAO
MTKTKQNVSSVQYRFGTVLRFFHSRRNFSVIFPANKMTELENINPNVYKKCEDRKLTIDDENEDVVDPFDEREVFDLIRNINDPEHPLTLEELHVLEQSLITVDNEKNSIDILFTPTIPHCSMATLIGLSIKVKLLRALPPRFNVTVEINPGTHASEHAVNKQLADKERVAAALENTHLMEVINQCISAPLK